MKQTPDFLKRFIAKIKFHKDGDKSESENGSGVLFKPTKESQYAYLFTAQHVFLNENEGEYKNFNDRKKLIRTSDIFIYLENYDKLIKPYSKDGNSYIYFLDSLDYLDSENTKCPKNLDFAFLVFDLSDNDLINKISFLEVEDSIDNFYDITNQIFYIYGYPAASENRSLNKAHPYKVKYNQDTSKCIYREDFYDFEGAVNIKFSNECNDDVNPNMGIHDDNEVKGLSGSGVFVLGQYGNAKLRSIFFEVAKHDIFTCAKLDTLIDHINDKINNISEELSLKLDQVQCGDKIFIEKEELDFSEYSDFSFFQDYVDKKNGLEKCLKNKARNYAELVDKYHEKEIRSISRELKEEVNTLDEKKEDLSFAYAKLALIAHKHKKRRATTVYFKQAIKLNPKHKQILLLEREGRRNSKKEIANYLSPIDAISELDKILKDESSEEDKEAILLELLKNIDKYLSGLQKDSNSQIDDKDIDYYIKKLEYIFDHKYEIREHYRYFNLGVLIFRHSNHKIKKYALYYFSISEYIAKYLPKTEGNLNFSKSVSNRISSLKNIIKDQETKITWTESEVEEKGKKVLEKKDAHYPQEISSMISKMYDKTEFLSNIKDNINIIKHDVDKLNTITEKSAYISSKNSDVLISNQQNLLSQKRSINQLHTLTHQAINQSRLLTNNLASLKVELYQLIQQLTQRLPSRVDLKKSILSAFSELDINKYNQYAQKLDKISENNGSVEFIEELNKKHEESQQRLVQFIEEAKSLLENNNYSDNYLCGELSQAIASLKEDISFSIDDVKVSLEKGASQSLGDIDLLLTKIDQGFDHANKSLEKIDTSISQTNTNINDNFNNNNKVDLILERTNQISEKLASSEQENNNAIQRLREKIEENSISKAELKKYLDLIIHNTKLSIERKLVETELALKENGLDQKSQVINSIQKAHKDLEKLLEEKAKSLDAKIIKIIDQPTLSKEDLEKLRKKIDGSFLNICDKTNEKYSKIENKLNKHQYSLLTIVKGNKGYRIFLEVSLITILFLYWLVFVYLLLEFINAPTLTEIMKLL
jgi:hypothetical protein